MPRGDGTGPGGMGPMTGRAAGYCAGYPVPGFVNSYGGRGMGMGWGRGGGMGMAWRRGRGGGGWGTGYGAPYAASGAPYAPYAAAYGAQSPWGAPSPEQEFEMLQGQSDWLKEQMDAIGERIQELKEKE